MQSAPDLVSTKIHERDQFAGFDSPTKILQKQVNNVSELAQMVDR
jgi:hypothetical protein